MSKTEPPVSDRRVWQNVSEMNRVGIRSDKAVRVTTRSGFRAVDMAEWDGRYILRRSNI
jgi:ribosomal protein L32E